MGEKENQRPVGPGHVRLHNPSGLFVGGLNRLRRKEVPQQSWGGSGSELAIKIDSGRFFTHHKKANNQKSSQACVWRATGKNSLSCFWPPARPLPPNSPAPRAVEQAQHAWRVTVKCFQPAQKARTGKQALPDQRG